MGLLTRITHFGRVGGVIFIPAQNLEVSSAPHPSKIAGCVVLLCLSFTPFPLCMFLCLSMNFKIELIRKVK